MTTLVDTARLPYGLASAYSVLPTVIARTAFFVAKSYRKMRPVFSKPALIGTVGPVEIFQTAGERLDEADCDVYLELVRRVCALPDDGADMLRLSFDANEFLPAINKERGTNNLVGLDAAIRRLKRAAFLFNLPGLRDYETSLVASIEGDETTLKARRYYTLTVDARMAKVFEKAHFTLLDLGIRRLLGSDYVAKKLYSYYASHSETRLVVLSRVRRILGREDMTDRAFVRDVLKPALKRLKDVTGWHFVRFNDTRGGIELYRTPAAKEAADRSIEKRKQSAPCVMAPNASGATLTRSRREPPRLTAPVSIELESWLRKTSSVQLEEIVTVFGCAASAMSREYLENAIRRLHLDGTTLSVMKSVELDDI